MLDESLVVGRRAELRRLDECARLARAGRAGVVLIEGGAGVGKSALVRQWLTGEDLAGGTLLRAFGDASESDLAFGLIGQLLLRVPRHSLERLPLLREGTVQAGVSPVQAGAQFLRLLDELQDIGPVVMVMEDVHWADSDSLQVLRFVLRRLEADHVLMVLTSRSPVSDELRRLVDQPGGVDLPLTGLDARAVAELAGHAAGGRASAQMVAGLRERTEGNPLYLRSLLSEIPAGTLRDGLPAGAAWPVPASLAAAVHAQLDSLPAPSRALVEAAAVLDTRTTLSAVGRVAAVDEPAVALQPALAANLMRWWPGDASTPVMITHVLQRDAITQALSPQRRSQLHRLAAHEVSTEAAWRHKVAAADAADDQLARQLEQAAQDHLVAGATERSATLLLWAADVAASRTEHERLLLTAAVRLLFATRVALVEPLLPRMQACAPTPLRSLALGSRAMLRRALDEAKTELTEAFQATVDDPAEQETPALAGTYLTTTYYFSCDYEAGIRAARQVLDLRDPNPIAVYTSKSNVAVGVGRLEGPWAGLQELQQLAPLPPAARVTTGDSFLLTIRGVLRVLCGMPAGGRDDLTQVLHLSKNGAGQGLEELANCYLAVAGYWSGVWDDATVQADLAIATSASQQRRYHLASIYSCASFVPSGRGETQHARELLHTAEQYALPFNRGIVHIGQAIEAQARADWPAMLEAIESLRRLPPSTDRFYEVLWKPLEVEAFLRTGDIPRTEMALSELAGLSNTYGSLRPGAAWLAGELAHVRGDLAAARTHYEEGLALPPTPDDHALHRAFLHHACGRLLAATGQTAQARIHLTQARDRYAALQALPYLTRCQTDLAASGAVPAPAPAEALTELTGRERDIAALASQGMTNKEIAGHLFISSKTVEHHLGHVYTKLNLSGRRQLRSLVPQ
ncbi:AAA family ATPase [Streptomyces sp. NBC_01614]|uniref:helix-turn-helix transcriptional regulator n=1 Tax=Streptomyces sp. NBC_01614 TaxID=2975897 RepID=UPI0038659216